MILLALSVAAFLFLTYVFGITVILVLAFILNVHKQSAFRKLSK